MVYAKRTLGNIEGLNLLKEVQQLLSQSEHITWYVSLEGNNYHSVNEGDSIWLKKDLLDQLLERVTLVDGELYINSQRVVKVAAWKSLNLTACALALFG